MKKLASIDLAVFSVLAVLSEAFGTLLLRNLSPMFYCSLAMAIAQIVMLRWGVSGVAVYAAAGAAAYLMSDMALLPGVLYHVIANLFLGLPMLIYGTRDRDALISRPVRLCVYILLAHLSLCVGKGLAIWIITGEITGAVDFFGTSLLVFFINALLLLILRRVDNLITDMRTYYRELQEQP